MGGVFVLTTVSLALTSYSSLFRPTRRGGHNLSRVCGRPACTRKLLKCNCSVLPCGAGDIASVTASSTMAGGLASD